MSIGLTLVLLISAVMLFMAPSASAQELEAGHLPCNETFEPPYNQPCATADEAIHFAIEEFGDLITFVFAVYDEAGLLVHTVECIAFPNNPGCP